MRRTPSPVSSLFDGLEVLLELIAFLVELVLS
jgi:hypothetical protein